MLSHSPTKTPYNLRHLKRRWRTNSTLNHTRIVSRRSSTPHPLYTREARDWNLQLIKARGQVENVRARAKFMQIRTRESQERRRTRVRQSLKHQVVFSFPRRVRCTAPRHVRIIPYNYIRFTTTPRGLEIEIELL